MPTSTGPLTLTPGAHAVVRFVRESDDYIAFGVYRARYDDTVEAHGQPAFPGRKSPFRGYFGGVLVQGQPAPSPVARGNLWLGHWYDTAEEAVQHAEDMARDVA